MLPRCLPSSFPSIQLTVREQITIEDLKDSWRCSKIFKKADNFSNSEYVASMPPIKFWLNQTYGLGDVIWRISRWLPWRLSWISERKDFSNCESLCHCEASHQVLAQSNLRLGGNVIWRISRWRPAWISEGYNFSNSESLCCCNASHQVLAQFHLRFGRRCPLKYFKMATMVAIFDMGTERFLQFWV